MNMGRRVETTVLPAYSSRHQAFSGFQLMWVGIWDLFFPPNLPSIALLMPAPEMKGTSHTGVYDQTSKVVYKGDKSNEQAALKKGIVAR